MKLLIVNDYGIKGAGTENRIILLINELIKHKYFSEIHLLEHEDSNSPQTVGVILHKCNTKNSKGVTKKIIKENNIDIVQIHNLAKISVRPIQAAKKLNVPVIFSAHDYWAFCGRRNLMFKNKKICLGPNLLKCSSCIGLKSYINTFINKYWLNKCDIGIAPSKFVINLYEKNKILNNKWIKILPWIDLEKFYKMKNISKDKHSILFVGPLSHAKGAYLIIDAFKIVSKIVPESKLIFVGSGQEKNNPDRIKIEQILSQNKLLDRVNFLGYKNSDELRYLFNTTSVYICCPIWPEVFGQTWAQAIACGCPVITTNTGSIPELINAEQYVSNLNPKDLAEKIIKVIKEDNYPSIVDLETNVKENFDPRTNINQILKIYKALVNK